MFSNWVRNRYTELRVYGYFVDFNGVEFGSVPDIFIFKPYEGLMDVRSLQAYPIGYLRDNTLVERGRRFVDMTRISHMQYAGLTAGITREHVCSSPINLNNHALANQALLRSTAR